MPEHPPHHLMGPYIRRFLLEHVVADRNLSRNTQRNYVGSQNLGTLS